MASTSSVMQLQGLSKLFGHNAALKEVDLEVTRGESVVLFGPNGAGKTTLIKVLATVMNPTSGKVTINGLDLKEDAEEIRRQIGVVTHQTFLYANLTSYENLEFYGRIYDVPGIKQRVKEVVAMVGMTARLHDRVGTLSRGMQQRISIARSVLHKPSIMLLDEPETGLDQQALSLLWEALRNDENQKRTMIMTTHNLERGLDLSERILILDKGQIVYQGLKESMDLTGLKETYQQVTGVSK